MRTWFIFVLGMVVTTLGFGQDTSSNSNTSSATPDAGVSFNLPSGSWKDIPENQSLVPGLEHKILEKQDPDKKIIVVFQTVRGYDVPSLMDQVTSIFPIHWGDIKMIQPLTLLSPETAVSGPRKYSSVYRIVEKVSQTPFRLEVVVVSTYDMNGNKGVLFILSPEYNDYENRFVIGNIRNGLKLDVDAAHNKDSKNTPTSGNAVPEQKAQ